MACSHIGGILGNVDPQMQQRLRLYGLNLGIAFQMVDDLLDFTSSESTLGKPVGSDISGGKLTFPLIYLIQCGEKYRQLVAQVFEQDGSATAIREEILDLLRKHKTLDLVREKSRAYVASCERRTWKGCLRARRVTLFCQSPTLLSIGIGRKKCRGQRPGRSDLTADR